MRFLDKTYSGKCLFASVQVVDLFVNTRDEGNEYPVFCIKMLTLNGSRRKAVSVSVPWAMITIGLGKR